MSGAIFVLKADGELVEMRQEGYLTEDHLQILLANYPSVLAGDQMNPTAPRRWVLVRREAGLAGEDGGSDRWSMDHLFLDQEAIPTIVEVKRSSDTRIRREVVGQMLDYAANAVVYLPVERIQTWFEQQCGERDPVEVLHEALGADLDAEKFWTQVGTNLIAGRVRLVFVADAIPAELRRIVEFLNSQMKPAEVLGVEVQQFVGRDGTKTLVPRVIGLTAATERAKGSGAPRSEHRWDPDAFLAAVPPGSPIDAIVRRLIDWAAEHGVTVEPGTGVTPGLRFRLYAFKTFYPLFFPYSAGKIYLDMATLGRRPVFDNAPVRSRLIARLDAIPGIDIPPERADASPSFPMVALEPEAALQEFLDAWSEAVDEVRRREVRAAAIAGDPRDAMDVGRNVRDGDQQDW
jgi:hypothetical protein